MVKVMTCACTAARKVDFEQSNEGLPLSESTNDGREVDLRVSTWRRDGVIPVERRAGILHVEPVTYH